MYDIYRLGDLNGNGLRNVIRIYPRPDGRKQSRYMQSRKLSSGRVGYYWSPPSWARSQGFPLHTEALGQDFIEALIRADQLNDFLDDWREQKKANRYKGHSDKSAYQTKVQKRSFLNQFRN